MPRLLISIALVITLLLLMKGIFSSPISEMVPGATDEKAKKIRPFTPARPTSLYPQVPVALPDFDKGYIFSADRTIEGEGKAGQESVKVSLDDIVYEGSLIAGEIRKAILAYPGQKATPGRTVIRPVTRTRAGKGDMSHVQVSEGETFSGYKVVMVSPEKIVFEKGGEKIEKNLYDSGKQREIVQSRPAPRQVPVVQPPLVPPQPVPMEPDDNNTAIPVGNEDQRQIRTFRRPPLPVPSPPPISPPGGSGGTMFNPFDNGR